MSITLGVAVYFLIWWTVLFAVLPFGIRTQGEAGDVVKGTPESAPVHPRLLRIALYTTLYSTIVFLGFWAMIRWNLIDLDWFFTSMPRA
jgi:predicted secreted protein